MKKLFRYTIYCKVTLLYLLSSLGNAGITGEEWKSKMATCFNEHQQCLRGFQSKQDATMCRECSFDVTQCLANSIIMLGDVNGVFTVESVNKEKVHECKRIHKECIRWISAEGSKKCTDCTDRMADCVENAYNP